MTRIDQEVFICLDCETTGLDPAKDLIIEVAIAKFTVSEILDEYETLIDPEIPISKDSMKIHNITDKMIVGKPKIGEELPVIFERVGHHTIVGHGIPFDVDLLVHAANRAGIPCPIAKNPQIDTLRLARFYGNSPTNSLERLCRHFNVFYDDTHRALSDVKMNIGVFKHLVRGFKNTQQLFDLLSRPIKLKHFPLGKHKGRLMKDVPLQYLQWAANKDFDEDLLFTIRSEIKRRRRDDQFDCASNPFSHL